MLIKYQELKETFFKILVSRNISKEDAIDLAEIFADNKFRWCLFSLG